MLECICLQRKGKERKGEKTSYHIGERERGVKVCLVFKKNASVSPRGRHSNKASAWAWNSQRRVDQRKNTTRKKVILHGVLRVNMLGYGRSVTNRISSSPKRTVRDEQFVIETRSTLVVSIDGICPSHGEISRDLFKIEGILGRRLSSLLTVDQL